jgi:hypothetical protein
MPQMPETAIHGGFTLTMQHFISEITDFPQQHGSQRPDGRQGRNANLTDGIILRINKGKNP